MSLDSITKSIAKDYGMEGIARIGVPSEDYATTFSLGTPGFDFCTYNAIPEGCFIEFSGAESSGKTTGAFRSAANYIRKEKQKPVEQRRHILFVDAEHTAKPRWALKSTGYDMNDKEIMTIYISPLGQSAEQIFDIVIKYVQSGEIGLVIFDSLSAIATQQVKDESLTKKDMGTLAKALGDFVRRSTGLFARYNTTFIGINGTIMNISGYGNPETTGGGTYWKRACSLRLKFKRGDYFDDDGNTLKSTAESPAGHVIEIAVQKTKFCRWDRKLGRCHLNYTKGIDLLQDTIEVATHFGLLDKSGGWYSFLDPDTGAYLLDENGKQIKVNGMPKVKAYLTEHKDIWSKLYDKVYELLSKQDDPNVKSFEQMLGINVEKEFELEDDNIPSRDLGGE